MNQTHPTDEKATTSKSSEIITLLQIVQNLFALGLNSVQLWHDVIPQLRTNDKICSHPELMNLQLLLVRISQHFSSKLFDFFPNDLSQEKLPNILAKEIPYKDLIKCVKPLLKKKGFCDRSFTIEASNILNSVVEYILKSINDAEENMESVLIDDEEKEEHNKPPRREYVSDIKRSSKKRRSSSPAQSDCSSAFSESEQSNYESESDSESDSDKFDKLFKGNKIKKGPVKIKQMFQTQKKRMRRKLVTPGEEGRFMVKIELTDTKDLKRCQPNQYWTKVSTKAVFLTEPKSHLYKQVDSLMYEVGRKIKTMPGSECEETKLDKKKSN